MDNAIKKNNIFSKNNGVNFKQRKKSFFKGKSTSFNEKGKKDRIAKRLSILGIASRREAEKLVLEGKIKINGVVCKELSYLVSYDDEISVNGKEIKNSPIKTKIYVMNKPAGYVTTTNDPQGRRTIFELIPSKFGKLMAVGRLDMNTEGLLLLTNNGEAARILEMPATQLKRIYFARVVGEISEKVEKQLVNLRNGIDIEGVHYGKIIVEKQPQPEGKHYNVLKIIIFEGKNNEIRRVMWHLGLRVVKLTRVQYGDFHLNGIPSGCIRESHTLLRLRELERRASVNIKAYNQGKAEAISKIKNKQNKQQQDKVEDSNEDNKNDNINIILEENNQQIEIDNQEDNIDIADCNEVNIKHNDSDNIDNIKEEEDIKEKEND